MNKKKSTFNLTSKDIFVSIVGYGTFITRGYWKDKSKVEPCLVKNFVRIFPEGNWFPYVLPLNGTSFWALKFCVKEGDLEKLDDYEGVSSNLFRRITIEIKLKSGQKEMAFIYIPTRSTIISRELTTSLDENDRWKEEIKKFPEIIKKFPELTL